jgi:hypothetical protein
MLNFDEKTWRKTCILGSKNTASLCGLWVVAHTPTAERLDQSRLTEGKESAGNDLIFRLAEKRNGHGPTFGYVSVSAYVPATFFAICVYVPRSCDTGPRLGSKPLRLTASRDISLEKDSSTELGCVLCCTRPVLLSRS